jgi:FixJ family two-component response regulator
METVKSSGANDLMQKPFDNDDLIERMQRLVAA